MEAATLGILLQMQDQATPQLRNFKSEAGGLQDTLAANRMAFRELAMGVTYLGTTFLSLGVAMESSNNQTLKHVGSIVMLAGGIMSAVGSSVQFISAIARMVDALKKLQVAEILSQAFSGPKGWATIAVGAAVAGGAVYGLSRMSAAETKASKAEAKGTTINVTQHIAGSVVTERQLTDNIQRALLVKGQRSYTTGIK